MTSEREVEVCTMVESCRCKRTVGSAKGSSPVFANLKSCQYGAALNGTNMFSLPGNTRAGS